MSTYCYYLEGGGDAVALFVEDEGAVFHPARCEEAYIAGAGQFLRCFAGVIVSRGNAADWADDVEVICDERFVGDEEEKGEFFENGDLGNFGIVDYL